jgi:hypothetical protein
VSNEADEARILAKAVVSLINEYTEPERSLCASLKLHRVEKAKKYIFNLMYIFSFNQHKSGLFQTIICSNTAEFWTVMDLSRRSTVNSRPNLLLSRSSLRPGPEARNTRFCTSHITV